MIIRGHGRDSADIFLVDDAPSAEDLASGYALSGSGGKTLNSLFYNYGENIENCFRTVYIKKRLVYNGNKQKELDAAYKQAREEVKAETTSSCDEILLGEIESVQPNIIVPLGEWALNYLTGLKHISKYRGSILPALPHIQQLVDKPLKVIPTFGPEMMYQNWTSRAYVNIDIKKICKYKEHYGEINPDGNIWICRSIQELHNYLQRCEWKDNFLVFDYETVFGIPTCISFCLSDNEAVTIPLLDSSIPKAETICMLQTVAKVLASGIPKINQNIKYDITIGERFGFKINNVTGDDTVIRAGLIYPELPKNLGFLTSIYTEMPYHKDEGKEIKEDTFDLRSGYYSKDKTKYYLYCAKDSLATRRVFNAQEEEIEEFNLRPIYENMKKLFHIYRKIDDRGILVDMEEVTRLIAKYKLLLWVHEAALRDLANREFNVRSPLQVAQLVFEDLKYPKRVSADEDTIEELISIDCKFAEGPAILREIIIIRKLFKVLEYLNTTLHPDNRWRANYNLSGTETGRTSCSHSIDRMFEIGPVGNVTMSKAGRSLQTITKHGFRVGGEVIGNDIRRIFVPTPGYILVECDLSQAEARVDAVLANDFDLLAKFDIKPGIHCLTASWLYGCKPEEIKKGTLEYHMGKIFRHAGERNIGAKTLSMQTHKTVRECEHLLLMFHKYSPNVREVFHRDIISYIRHNRNLTSPHGRRRDFFGRPDNNMFNEAISFYPQAVVGDQNKFSFIPISEEMGDDVTYLNEAHDSSLVEIKKEHLERYATTVKKHLEIPIDFTNGSIYRDFNLTIPCEITWGERWYEPEMKKVEV